MLFDFINDLSHGKKGDLINEHEKEYKPYLVNKAFSFGRDTVMYANEMNKENTLDAKMQHDFYFLLLRKKKRFNPWLKKENNSDIDVIKEFYNYNEKKAKEIYCNLKKKDIEEMKKILDEGGTNGS